MYFQGNVSIYLLVANMQDSFLSTLLGGFAKLLYGMRTVWPEGNFLFELSILYNLKKIKIKKAGRQYLLSFSDDEMCFTAVAGIWKHEAILD